LEWRTRADAPGAGIRGGVKENGGIVCAGAYLSRPDISIQFGEIAVAHQICRDSKQGIAGVRKGIGASWQTFHLTVMLDCGSKVKKVKHVSFSCLVLNKQQVERRSSGIS
jgi:hypothetical protein